MPKASPAIIAKKKRLIRQLKESDLTTPEKFAVHIDVGTSVAAGWWIGEPVGPSMARLEAAIALVRKGASSPPGQLKLRDDPPPQGVLIKVIDARVNLALKGLDNSVARIVDARLGVLLGLGSQ